MQINVTTRHGHLNDETQGKITAKAEKLLRFFDRITSIELIVDLEEPSKPRVDLKVDAEHKHDFQSHDQSDNLLSAVESAVQKMEQQLRRYKEKMQGRGRNPSSRRVDAGDGADAGTEEE